MRTLFNLMGVLLLLSCVVACENEGDNQQKPGGKKDTATVDNDSDGVPDSDTDDNKKIEQEDDTETDTVQEWICPDGVEPPVYKDDPLNGCYCIRMAVIGIFDSAADDGDADVSVFVDWLNNDSSAVVDLIDKKPTMNEEFLNNYDIIVLILQSDGLASGFWEYSSDEADAVKKWVEEGNGLLTLTGFNGTKTVEEVAATNSLLKPVSGMSYNTDEILSECQTDLVDVTDNCTCWTDGQKSIQPIRNFDSKHPVAANGVERIGAFWGYSINAPDGAQIIAKEGKKNTIVGTEVGEGRVLSIADEWPLFKILWDKVDPKTMSYYSKEINEYYQKCYDFDNEYWMTPDQYFQHPQFWFNAIKWTAPENECFSIQHPQIIVE